MEEIVDKNDMISMLRDAVRTHKQWTENALSLIKGIPLDKKLVPINSTDCEFGKWYYGEGQNIRSMPGFKEIEDLHGELHDTYREIFVILFGEIEETASFFSRLFGQSHKMTNENRQVAMNKYNKLHDQSEQITKQLIQIEKMVTAMADEQLESYLS